MRTFTLEDRYIVIKRADLIYLSKPQIEQLKLLCKAVSAGRASRRKPTRHYVVVQDNWPEYNGVVAAIKRRVIAGQPRADWEAAEAASMVDASAAATILSLSSANQVRQRVRDHKLFGVIAPGRERGMLFPVWQFDRSVIGEPLQQVLTALHAQDLQGWAIHEFFEEPRVTLEGLSARQVLTGTVDSGGYAPSAHRLLAAASQERLARVLTVVHSCSNLLGGG